jgi:small multidrug resistance family-3 protein
VTVARSLGLFVLAALFEIGGAWLVWQGLREHRGPAWIGGGFVALSLYGLVATLQPSADFGRILAAYGGIFVAGSPTATVPTGSTSSAQRPAWPAWP